MATVVSEKQKLVSKQSETWAPSWNIVGEKGAESVSSERGCDGGRGFWKPNTALQLLLCPYQIGTWALSGL